MWCVHSHLLRRIILWWHVMLFYHTYKTQCFKPTQVPDTAPVMPLDGQTSLIIISPLAWHHAGQVSQTTGMDAHVNNRQNIYARITSPCVRGMHKWSVDCVHNKESVMLPCHGGMYLNLHVVKRVNSTVVIKPRKLRNKTAIASRQLATIKPGDDFWHAW